jgi:hypothetical protein
MGLCIFGINVSKHPKASSSTQYLVKNFMTVVHVGQEHLEIASTHLVEKGIIERKPQLVLRRPGLFVKEVQVLELKVGHHSELPLAGSHVKPKLQVNIQTLCFVCSRRCHSFTFKFRQFKFLSRRCDICVLPDHMNPGI